MDYTYPHQDTVDCNCPACRDYREKNNIVWPYTAKEKK